MMGSRCELFIITFILHLPNEFLSRKLHGDAAFRRCRSLIKVRGSWAAAMSDTLIEWVALHCNHTHLICNARVDRRKSWMESHVATRFDAPIRGSSSSNNVRHDIALHCN